MDETTTFEYIMSRIFKKGSIAAVDYYGQPMPSNPYKRPQYKAEWKRGYQLTTANIRNNMAALEFIDRLPK